MDASCVKIICLFYENEPYINCLKNLQTILKQLQKPISKLSNSVKTVLIHFIVIKDTILTILYSVLYSVHVKTMQCLGSVFDGMRILIASDVDLVVDCSPTPCILCWRR